MPTPSRNFTKNATGLLKGIQLLCASPHGQRFTLIYNPAFTVSSLTKQQNRYLHAAPYTLKQRQVIPPSSEDDSPAPPNKAEILAEIAASAWSTSVINTGYPFYNEFLATIHQDPSPPPPRPRPQLQVPYLDFSSIYWSVSPTNPGASLSDVLFGLSIPPRSLDAYDNIMASDEDYAAFLDRAAADRQPQQSTQSKVAQPVESKVNTESLHPALQNIHQHTYISDADEAFEPVSLTRDASRTGAIDAKEVAHIAGGKVKESDVEELSISNFDPRGEYKQVVKQIEGASKGDVKVWKVERGGARLEYWILGVSGDGHIVGARAKAVES